MSYLIIGLGNPGTEYANTRHNIGFIALDAIASQYNAPVFTSKFDSQIMRFEINTPLRTVPVILQKPMTYMNLSGKAVMHAAIFYKVVREHIIVIHDDLDLVCGKIKVKVGGGNAGHNGLKSIDSLISPNYMRIRIGISRPLNSSEVSKYVLSEFTGEQLLCVMQAIECITTNLPTLLMGDKERFTQLCHMQKI